MASTERRFVVVVFLLVGWFTTAGGIDYLDKLQQESRVRVLRRLLFEAGTAEQKSSLSRKRETGPFFTVQKLLNSTVYAQALTVPAAKHIEAMKIFMEVEGISKDEAARVFHCQYAPKILDPNDCIVFPDRELPHPTVDQCPFPPDDHENACDSEARYRAIDGCCNNLKHALWGRAFIPLRRFLYPDYGDGVDTPRRAKQGKALPSARAVSLSLYEAIRQPSPVHTLMHMVFGQFLDHDLTKTAISQVKLSDGTLMNVFCGDFGCDDVSQACFPIAIDPKNDPVFGGDKCLEFVRSAGVVSCHCTGPRQQLNQITSFIDASVVYGNDVSRARELRQRDTGCLKRSNPPKKGMKDMLPVHDDETCVDVDETTPCFLAGDKRVNVHVGLSAVHTLFHREHNYLVSGLAQVNPHWDGDGLYQEARRILGAFIQIIVYNEYLPILLGHKLMHTYGLSLQKCGYFEGYDEEVSPDISNVFATAAFRFGHSQVPDMISFADQNYSQVMYTEFSNVFMKPTMNYRTDLPGGMGVDSVVLGMISQPGDGIDRYFSPAVSAHLFTRHPPHGAGTDLPALSTQRGRDHGIPGYNYWREWCDLPKLAKFDDLADVIPDKIVRDKFKALYRHVDDIDLFPAAMAERHAPGSLVGPTFGCIMALQFRFLKIGDRFWHEGNDPYAKFTKAQLQELRKVTLARIVCNNLDYIEDIQKFVLLQPRSVALANMKSSGEVMDILELYAGDSNIRRPCSEIPRINLEHWAE